LNHAGKKGRARWRRALSRGLARIAIGVCWATFDRPAADALRCDARPAVGQAPPCGPPTRMARLMLQ